MKRTIAGLLTSAIGDLRFTAVFFGTSSGALLNELLRNFVHHLNLALMAHRPFKLLGVWKKAGPWKKTTMLP